MRTDGGFEIDFYAERHGDAPLLIQVSLDVAMDATWESEVRSLAAAASAYPQASALLITLDSSPPSRALPPPIKWMSAAQWLLQSDT